MHTALAAIVASMLWVCAPDEPKAEPFAIVELFTSEGCSSCPPADRVLGEMVASASRDGTRVFPLAFHVDYWDRLGWKDPYASAAASRRQREYAAKFTGAGVYTPQIIVNGTDQFVGSDGDRSKKAVAQALKAAAEVGVCATAMRDGAVVTVSVVVGAGAGPDGVDVIAALVQRGLTSTVKAGENSGRVLTHENVVRDFRRASPAREGATKIALAAPDGGADLGVIVYVQERGSKRILGAARAAIAEPAAKP